MPMHYDIIHVDSTHALNECTPLLTRRRIQHNWEKNRAHLGMAGEASWQPKRKPRRFTRGTYAISGHRKSLLQVSWHAKSIMDAVICTLISKVCSPIKNRSHALFSPSRLCKYWSITKRSLQSTHSCCLNISVTTLPTDLFQGIGKAVLWSDGNMLQIVTGGIVNILSSKLGVQLTTSLHVQ